MMPIYKRDRRPSRRALSVLAFLQLLEWQNCAERDLRLIRVVGGKRA
jgi:hypothetical protein